MKMINTQINFGGFYESIHSNFVYEAIAYSIGADDKETGEIDYNCEAFDTFDNYNEVEIKYCKEYLQMFNAELETNITFKDLDSPREYNFNTDVILIDITYKDTIKLFKHIKRLELKEKVFDRLKAITTSVSGYCAFYSYEQMFKSEHRYFLIESIIDVLLAEYKYNDELVYVEEFYI